MEPELPKRLAPTKETVRHLFAHSGNRCAYDPCDHPLIDEFGNFVAEICHIKSALPEGERFDEHMSNEDRRAPGNLLLMCHRHHVVTDDVARFDVAAMLAIKAGHESRFAASAASLSDAQVDQAVGYFVDSAIADRTFETPFRIPLTCARMNDVLGWGVSSDQAADTARDIAQYVRNLRRVPVDARAILAAAVDRGSSADHLNHSMVCLLMDVALATTRSREEVAMLGAILEKWRVGRVDGDVEDDGYEYVVVRGHDIGWNMWQDVKLFAELTGVTVRDFAVDLRFDVLDGDGDGAAPA